MKGTSNLITLLFVLISFFLASLGFIYSYSYWWDELYSVVGASLPIEDMFKYLVLPDVHPPLYQVVLKGWVFLFGSDERVLRLLSFLFSTLALIFVWRWGKTRFDKMFFQTLIVLFTTSYLFPYYAQEVRAYGMMLFLSTVVTIAYLDRWYKNSSFLMVLFYSVF